MTDFDQTPDLLVDSIFGFSLMLTIALIQLLNEKVYLSRLWKSAKNKYKLQLKILKFISFEIFTRFDIKYASSTSLQTLKIEPLEI